MATKQVDAIMCNRCLRWFVPKDYELHTQCRLIPSYLNDDQAERIGQSIAVEFGLSKLVRQPDRWITQGGTFTNKGIARRAHRLITEGL